MGNVVPLFFSTINTLGIPQNAEQIGYSRIVTASEDTQHLSRFDVSTDREQADGAVIVTGDVLPRQSGRGLSVSQLGLGSGGAS